MHALDCSQEITMSTPALIDQRPPNAFNLAPACSNRRLYIVNVRVSYAHRTMAEELATSDGVPLATVIEQALEAAYTARRSNPASA
jgi:hypothetical protein